MTASLDPKVTPMMAQWHECKESAPGAILLFRLGDFYEAFYEDASLISKELDLTLTKRQDIPMAGVPYHASDSYIDKLVSKGYRVAIAEQMEDPKLVKGLVKRKIVRVVTPGTLVTSSLLSEKSNNFLAALTQINTFFGLSILDLTTSEFYVIEIEDQKQLFDELCRLRPKELLISEKCKKNFSYFKEMQDQLSCVVNTREEWHFDHSIACEFLLKHFHLLSLDGFGLKGMVAAINSAGALLSYVKDELCLQVSHIKTIRTEQLSSYMSLDVSTLRHLEITDSLYDKGSSNTLLNLLDQTATPMGGRLLKHLITHPLLCKKEIAKRQDAIEAFLNNPEKARELYSHLQEVRDLERLIMRICTAYASPRDLVSLRFSLEAIPKISPLLEKLQAELIEEDRQKLKDLSTLTKVLQDALVEDPPLKISEGGIIKGGYSQELDELRSLKADSQSWMARYQGELKETTGIKTLKISYTKAFGYYIEVSRGQADKMPDTFQRRQTLINAERFISPELKDYEHKMLTAEERIFSLEASLFNKLREEAASYADEIRSIASAIARLDCMLSLATVAKENSYVRPLVDDSDLFHVEEGRHPVIEAALLKERFIPNDVFLDDQSNRLLLITGPNMAGKSTFIRQTALLAIMAQIGSFLPAKSAHIGIIDKVFSRIGASDDLARGQSTFMVEMTETANILNNATSRSLVILDEIGRGTSTYDGISIAWAVAEYLLTTKERFAKTLFATHYWELTELEKKIPGAVNYHVAIHEGQEGIVFLRKIVKGSTDKSYGIHVAKLAGLPYTALRRAQEMLTLLEKQANKPSEKKGKAEQLSFLTPKDASADVIAELKKTDLNQLTPIDAHRKLFEWQKSLKGTN